MFIVGLTGGIGCGKTTASRLFEKLGVIVLDADEVGKELVHPGSPLLSQIHDHFGETILNPDGSLNRSTLRKIIFNEPTQKKQLETLMHPPILKEMQLRAKTACSPYCIFSIPLLFETNQDRLVNRILVIDIPPELQTQRVALRSGLPAEQIEAIIKSQVSRQHRLKHADDVVDNSQSIRELEAAIQSLHKKYMEFSIHAS